MVWGLSIVSLRLMERRSMTKKAAMQAKRQAKKSKQLHKNAKISNKKCEIVVVKPSKTSAIAEYDKQQITESQTREQKQRERNYINYTIFKTFNRIKYNRYLHQYPRQPESYRIRLINREWSMMSYQSKVKLMREYKEKQFIRPQDEQEEVSYVDLQMAAISLNHQIEEFQRREGIFVKEEEEEQFNGVEPAIKEASYVAKVQNEGFEVKIEPLFHELLPIDQPSFIQPKIIIQDRRQQGKVGEVTLQDVNLDWLDVEPVDGDVNFTLSAYLANKQKQQQPPKKVEPLNQSAQDIPYLLDHTQQQPPKQQKFNIHNIKLAQPKRKKKNSYIEFYQQLFPVLRKQNKDIDQNTITRIISQLWKCEKAAKCSQNESTKQFFHKYYDWQGVGVAKREEMWRRMTKEGRNEWERKRVALQVALQNKLSGKGPE